MERTVYWAGILAALHFSKYLPYRQQIIIWCPFEIHDISGRAKGLHGLNLIVIIQNKSPVAVKISLPKF